ncbi:LacI family DNA-binding transcriptional regulator [Phycicoccus sp. M110.8]|uniref:LacI family DNA-binding transcriptional regulator n=1 Tax=Phycicoccus sp. M110.8 TaxID=3075433 RepID=UPI0028FDB0BA|nr:LacI family DNA-binding transcriptional regulator [Phycicoccus sp. M110.8]MDU0313539.1 LacI family DNA-binding transcriptional regulator [Phycicoccus sp. M110.8]
MHGVTSADVARDSGVSRTTVSYVLNDTPGVRVSEETRARVRASADRLGYHPSVAARTLRTGRSDLVLYVLPDWPLGPAVDTLLDRLAGALAERGLSLLVHHARSGRPLHELWRAVTPRAVVGLQAFSARDRDAMRRAGIHVVASSISGDVPDVFAATQQGIGRLQARHLLERGHTPVGYAAPTDPRVRAFAELRLAGVQAVCAEAGLPAPVVVPVELTQDSARAAVRAWRDAAAGTAGTAGPGADGTAAPAVAGVAAYNDDVALAVLAGARAEGVPCPGELAVVGVDDIPAARFAEPALSTVSQSLDTQAEHLAAAVVAALDGTDSDGGPVPDTLELVERAST